MKSFFFYKIYNLAIRTDFVLKNLQQFKNKHHYDVEFIQSKFSSPDNSHTYFDEKIIYINTKHGYKFKISNGNKIEYVKNKSTSGHLYSIIQGLPFSYMLFQRGYYLLHGSSFTIGENAIALVGLSGSGKSTLLSKMIKCGFDYFSDDIVAIDDQNFIYPYTNLISTSIPLDKEESELFQKIDDLNDERDRSIYKVLSHCKSYKKLKACYFLEWGNENEINQITTDELVKKLLINSFRQINFHGNKEIEKVMDKNFLNKMALFSNIKCFQFSRDKDEKKIDISAKLLSEHI